MFDYQTSKHAHFDAACRAFALSHNLEDVAAAVGMRPQILRNKLNPIQPHRLTCDELLAITPIWCCAGLPGTWNDHNLLKTAFCVCLSASWSAYSNASGHVPSSTPRCAMWPAG
ncbi:MAG: regulatory protein [Enterobacter mori]|nr:regulatory protein [Enterobacter mori]